jgi:hypothetical protein
MKIAHFTETHGIFTINVEICDGPCLVIINFIHVDYSDRERFACVVFDKRANFREHLYAAGLYKYLVREVYGGDAGIIDYARRLIS